MKAKKHPPYNQLLTAGCTPAYLEQISLSVALWVRTRTIIEPRSRPSPGANFYARIKSKFQNLPTVHTSSYLPSRLTQEYH